MDTKIKGLMFRISIRARVAYFRISPRPNISLNEGFESVREGMETLKQLASDATIDGMVFDLREDPRLPGPKSRQMAADLIGHLEAQRRRVVFLITARNPVESLFFERLVQDHAPTFGTIRRSIADARQWILETQAP